jgi:hypothetical protein
VFLCCAASAVGHLATGDCFIMNCSARQIFRGRSEQRGDMTMAWGTMGGGGGIHSYRVFVDKPDRKNCWKDTGVGGSITLEYVWKKYGRGAWTGNSGLG